ncbi:Iron-sulfur cluster assembly protein [Rhizoctonia solani]|uniref:Iron-sulfur cluster assembly protein n=1 Tax=Rhizoctonia solani TaxID=456999 RepID=A0A8H7HBJ1_9AGAM|nr:Iron-sulfur cluster assembly protein [Rhizoctonia solani]
MSEKINSNPIVFAPTKTTTRKTPKTSRYLWSDEGEFQGTLSLTGGYPVNSDKVDGVDIAEEEEEPIDSEEIFDLLRSINDPEHPLTLEQLKVVSAEQITVSPNHVMVRFTPTIPHCSMATLIGLSMRVRLLRSLPSRYKVDIMIQEGTHQSENAVNKQLNDKERVAAALENSHLLGVVEQCLSTAHQRGVYEQ